MATTGSSRRRVFAPDSPSNLVNVPIGKQRDTDIALLLAKIKAFYREAQRRLLAKVRPATAARLLRAGYCFGLLDPISNIVVNTLSAGSIPDQREALLKGGVVRGKRLQDAEKRSLDGLVTFLTCFFPYLDDWEAVRYLLLADADPLLAARLIVHERGLKRFDFTSSATAAAVRMSLKCAALGAEHPEPDKLVSTWMSLSARLDQHAVTMLSEGRLITLGRLRELTKLVSPMSAEAPDLMRRCWDLAAFRLQERGDDVYGKAMEFKHRRSLRRALLDTIHGFYLRALARLPAGELRSKYHRSLLDAGHCYGPMDDPVSNILINTVWYEAAAFPPTKEKELDMDDAAAAAQRLLRIASRSLYGLLSFLGTRYPDLELPDAIRCLLTADADLSAAATEAERLGQRPHGTVQEAYAAAAAAAWHPQPDAQAQRLSSCSTHTISIASSLLQNGGPPVSSQDLMRLGSLLVSVSPMPDAPPEQQRAAVVPRLPQDGRIYTNVKAALTRYSLQRDDHQIYEVHVICGVNENVSGPELRMIPKRHSCLPYSFHYHRTHVNFLASAAAAGVDGPAPAPMLFFAELSNDHDDEDEIMCCPVTAPPPCTGQLPRCLYCDHEASGIVHPAVEGFHGRELEFQKMVCREDLFDDEFDAEIEDQHFTNYNIIEQSESIAEWVEEGCYYDILHEGGCSDDDDDD